MKKLYTIFGAMMLLTSTVFAQDILFEDDFEDGNASSRWTVNESGGLNTFNLGHDYSGDGIPAAPNGTGTTGFKITVNTDPDNGTGSQVMGFPTGMTFSGNYIFTCDIWMNVDLTTSGTTEFGAFGIQHTADTVPSGNGIDMLFTGEGGSSRDLRIVRNGVELRADGANAGNYENGQNTLDSNGPYEPYVQSWTGDTGPHNQWLTLKATVAGDMVEFAVNDIVWGRDTLLTDGGNIVEGNIVVGVADFFSSVAPITAQFGIIDNVKVEAVTATLSGITLGGEALADFSPATTEYDVVLPFGSTAADIPTVDATAIETSTVEVTQATTLPGDATILVTDLAGEQKTYTISFSALVITGALEEKFNLYPNPVRDVLTIESSKKLNAYKIIDMHGKVLKQATVLGASKVTLDTQQLEAGIYVIQVQSEDGISTSRFIKE